jgi:hypothetical protein
LAWTCVFSKQSLQPGLCGRSQLQEQVLSPALAPLLPKLRGHFAEFLNHGSLDRLGILYLTTCVGLGYGPRCRSLEAFLGSIGSLTSPQSARHRISGYMRRGFAYVSPYVLTPGLPSPGLSYLPASPHRLPTTGSVHALRQDQSEDVLWFQAFSITGVSMGATTRVREYQPVVHRLRLSASP